MKVLYNARIYTLDKAAPLASAIVIDHGEILAVGGDELLAVFDRADKQDLQGYTVLPGLTDAHLHLQYYALSLQKINCETDTLEECLQRVKEKVQGSRPGEWILGHGWNQNSWGNWPSASDLDRVAPDNPVYLTAKSLHAAWANSAALKLAGVTAGMLDPKDGQVQRTAQGQPTGILLENAVLLISDLVPEPGIAALADAIETAQPILWKMGLTGVHDFDRRDCFLALQQLHIGRRLKLRVIKNIPLELLDHAYELGLRTGFGDEWLRIGSVKVFMDGALGPRTAAMFNLMSANRKTKGTLTWMANSCLSSHAGPPMSGLG